MSKSFNVYIGQTLLRLKQLKIGTKQQKNPISLWSPFQAKSIARLAKASF